VLRAAARKYPRLARAKQRGPWTSGSYLLWFLNKGSAVILSAVRIVAGYVLDDQGIEVQVLVGSTIFTSP
jgi:hypothetical protein